MFIFVFNGLLLAFPVLALSFSIRHYYKKMHNKDAEYWDKIIKKFHYPDNDKMNNSRILFLGDSNISYWKDLEETFISRYPEFSFRKTGLPGCKIQPFTYFFNELVNSFQPEMFVFAAGENDVNELDPQTPESVFLDFNTFYSKFRNEYPVVPFFFLFLKPSPLRMKTWPIMKEVNTKIRENFLEDKNFYCIDVTKGLLDENNRIISSLFRPDMIHLRKKAYTKSWEPLVLENLFFQREINLLKKKRVI